MFSSPKLHGHPTVLFLLKLPPQSFFAMKLYSVLHLMTIHFESLSPHVVNRKVKAYLKYFFQRH
jgi:hypothetical protein